MLGFGIGYPPKLWGIRFGKRPDAAEAGAEDPRTEYTINALPLGGFVRMLGEEDPSDPRKSRGEAQSHHASSFPGRTRGRS